MQKKLVKRVTYQMPLKSQNNLNKNGITRCNNKKYSCSCLRSATRNLRANNQMFRTC